MELKNKYLSKKGEISLLLAGLGKMDIEERKTWGSLVNTLKQEVSELIIEKEKQMLRLIIPFTALCSSFSLEELFFRVIIYFQGEANL